MRFFIIIFSIFFTLSYGQDQVVLKHNITHLETFSQGEFPHTKTLYEVDFQNRMQLLDSLYTLPMEVNSINFYYTQKYLSYNWIGKVIGLSGYYFPLFEKKLAQYNLPMELKYLSVVESALNPRAESIAGAMGLWQFMPETGNQLGLKHNDYINIFFDPVANTDSAFRYLKQLNDRFGGDWLLSISAYNCGAGNVDKAIKKAKSTHYWEIRPYLPKETQAYVPTFLAVTYLFHFYDKHNITPPIFKYKFTDLKMVKVEKSTTFQEVSKKHKTPINLLKFANPQFLTEVVPKGSIIYTL